MADAFFGVDLAVVANQLDASLMFHPTFTSIAARLAFNGSALDLSAFSDE